MDPIVTLPQRSKNWEYIVIEGNSAEDVGRKYSLYRNSGWHPLGGVFVLETPAGRVYMQAMEKRVRLTGVSDATPDRL